MDVREVIVYLPTKRDMETGAFDAWELLPEIDGLAGRRVRITLEDLDSQEKDECICQDGPHSICDEECKLCQLYDNCQVK